MAAFYILIAFKQISFQLTSRLDEFSTILSSTDFFSEPFSYPGKTTAAETKGSVSYRYLGGRFLKRNRHRGDFFFFLWIQALRFATLTGQMLLRCSIPSHKMTLSLKGRPGHIRYLQKYFRFYTRLCPPLKSSGQQCVPQSRNTALLVNPFV